MARRDPMPTPLWLTDIDYPAPCFCGNPTYPGEALMMVESEEGLKRVVHMRCLPPDMIPDGMIDGDDF